MVKELKRHVYLSRKDYLIITLFTVAIALFITVLVSGVLVSEGESEAFEVGTIFFFAVGALMSWGLLTGTTASQFNIALKMGATRRHYLLASAGIGWLYTFLILMAGNLWRFVDKGIASFYHMNTSGKVFLSVPTAAGIALAVTLLGCWSGLLLMRHGKKAFWVIWALFFFPSIFSSRISNIIQSERTDGFTVLVKNIASFFSSFPVSGYLILAGIALTAVFIHTLFIACKIAAQD